MNTLVILAALAQCGHWHTDYYEAQVAAEKRYQNLLINFTDNSAESQDLSTHLHTLVLYKHLKFYTTAELPTTTTITYGDAEHQLIKEDFAKYLYGQPGIVIINYSNPEDPTYNYSVSAIPARYLNTQDKILKLLQLPEGSITQRTMIWALRTHPARPQSVNGPQNNYLRTETALAAQYQAQIGQQGHHNWNARFARISNRIPGLAKEIVSETWPGRNRLVPAALDLVNSWYEADRHQAVGHWGVAMRRTQAYSYDMAYGSNGLWYSSGIVSTQ